jgi:hypothetical protein
LKPLLHWGFVLKSLQSGEHHCHAVVAELQ